MTDYLALRDSQSTVWYLFIDTNGNLAMDDMPTPVPPVPIVDYLIVRDDLNMVWYVTVLPIGQVQVADIQPAGVSQDIGHGATLQGAGGLFYRVGVLPDEQILAVTVIGPTPSAVIRIAFFGFVTNAGA